MSSDVFRVFVGVPGNTLFARLKDRRLRVYPTGYNGELEPDLVVFPSSIPARFDPEALALPPSVAARLRAGQCRVAFDASLEGTPHSEALTGLFHGALRRLGVTPGQAIYITQDRGYEADYGRYCQAAGLGPPMTVLVYDYWIRRFFTYAPEEGEALFHSRLDAFRRRSAERARRFVSLNWSPRPHKILFLLRLLRDGLWSEGHISFGGFEQLRRTKNKSLLQVQKKIRTTEGFEDLAATLLPFMPTLDAFGEISLDDTGGDGATGQVPDKFTGDTGISAFETSWFSVVTETEMLARPCRITEKPFRALVNFHPIVVLGNPGALRLIRELGFESFGGLFDESYDDEPDPRARFERVYDEVARLCRMDEAELARRVSSLSDQLVFNAQWGLTKLPDVFRNTIDRDLVTRVIDGGRARPR